MYNHAPLYVFLFTDDCNPQRLVDKYKKLVGNSNIEFACRTERTDYFYNVLEDFFSMMYFDILIRPDSNFSIMAEKLGFHSVIISPGDFLNNSFIQEGIVTIKNPKILEMGFTG